jgi:hypothetical protein
MRHLNQPPWNTHITIRLTAACFVNLLTVVSFQHALLCDHLNCQRQGSGAPCCVLLKGTCRTPTSPLLFTLQLITAMGGGGVGGVGGSVVVKLLVKLSIWGTRKRLTSVSYPHSRPDSDNTSSNYTINTHIWRTVKYWMYEGVSKSFRTFIFGINLLRSNVEVYDGSAH